MQVVHLFLLDLAGLRSLIDGATGFEDLLCLEHGIHVAFLDLLAAQVLLELRQRVVDRLQIGENELCVDRVDVIVGIDMAVHMDDVVVFERSHDLADCIRLANVREELVAQSLAFARSP